MSQNRGWRDLISMLDNFRGRGLLATVGAAALVACGLWPSQVGATLVLSQDGRTVYDTVNNVTWLADADLAATNRFGLPVCNGPVTQPCVNQSGSMDYASAAAWVAAMNAAGYLGHTNWRLPTTPSTDSTCPFTGPHGNSFGFGCVACALGSLYYSALGLKAPNTAVPIPSNTVGPFTNFQPYLYWSQTVGGSAADACKSTPLGCGNATFSFNTGFHGANVTPEFLYVLPMIPGKIPGTPPATGNGLQVNPGGQTVYDPVANVTWLANANLAATNTFGLPPCKDQGNPKPCVNQDGAMNLDSANQFVMNMNTYSGAGYLGQTHWELPPLDPSCPSYNCDSNPMGELFYDQLGFSRGTPVVATPNIAVGPFNNIQPYLYWSCLGATIQDACQTDGPASGFEWSFSFGNGFQDTDILANDLYVTAYFVGARGPTISVWLPVGSHASGLNGSEWRSDVGVLNPNLATANIEVVLHFSGGTKTNNTQVAPGSQAILTDIVNQLGYTGSGALEVQSDQPVVVTSRTYNQSGNGTFGQDYASYSSASALGTGQSAWLPQLSENAAYRTNISLTNTGSTAASVNVTLLD
ncbi:MAG: hypothetical protein ACHP7P_15220, partial [Terriglobales bacterium]